MGAGASWVRIADCDDYGHSGSALTPFLLEATKGFAPCGMDCFAFGSQ